MLSLNETISLSVLTWHNNSQWHATLQSLDYSRQHVAMHASKSRSIRLVGLQCSDSLVCKHIDLTHAFTLCLAIWKTLSQQLS